MARAVTDITAKQAYEWVRTGHWNLNNFTGWLKAKGINAAVPLYRGFTLIHRSNAQLAFEWVITKYWDFRKFQTWLSSFL